VDVLVWGDEYYQRVESTDGYTLIKDPVTKWICYAELSSDGSEYVSTGEPYTGGSFTAGHSAKKAVLSGRKALKIKHDRIRKKREDARKLLGGIQDAVLPAPGAAVAAAPIPAPPAITRTGAYKGLTLLIDFPDAPASITRGAIDNFCNMIGYKEYTNYGSIRDYFLAASGNKLDYTNYVAAYYKAKNNKAYYTDSAVSYGTRARELIVEALQALDASGFDFTTLSIASNRIIAVNAMYAGSVDNAWSEGLWPHSGTFNAGSFSADGVSARRYQISNIGTQLSIRTFIHENGHMLMQWPDLYDYGDESNGAGNFCVMAGGANDKRPVMPNPYLRDLSGWETVTEIDSATNAVFTWPSNQTASLRYANLASVYEGFYLETKFKSGWNNYLPGSGLVIWHVEGNGSNDNEQMTCDQHYMVSVEQADGLFHLENNTNSGAASDVWTSAKTQGFSDTTVPDSTWWCDGASGLIVTGISAAGNTMNFRIGAGVIIPSATATLTLSATQGTPPATATATAYVSATIFYTATVTCTRTPTGTVTYTRTRTATRTTTPTRTPLPEGYKELQAENACYFDGVIETTQAGYTGAGYVNTDNAAGAAIVFYLDSASSGAISIGFRYANGSANSRNMSITVNGQAQAGNVLFPPTGSLTTWLVAYVTVNLVAGRNEVTIEAITAEGGPNTDLIVFVSTGVNIASCIAPTATVTVSSSATATRTFTRTVTPTATPSGTATPTFTGTVTRTVTMTVTQSGTATPTFTGTVTPTVTPSGTASPTFTGTVTRTVTMTVTPSRTATPSGTCTITLTVTPTYTCTLTLTVTCTFTVTATHTPTTTATSDTRPLVIDNVVIFPNPYNPAKGGLKIAADITGTAVKLSVRIYTAAYRLVIKEDESGSFTKGHVITVPQEKTAHFAAGIYYVAFEAEANDSGRFRARLQPLVILR
jgi:M6 family metalloprotease-like protein